MLGCDYCDTIKGVGPKTALKLIREHGCIENVLKHLDGKKYVVPESWMPPSRKEEDEESDHENSPQDNHEEDKETPIPAYVLARRMFNEHEVLTHADLKWKPCEREELTKFLVDEMGFNPDRVASSIDKLEAAYKANKAPQTRMDAFFAVQPKKPTDVKRKVEPAVKGKGAKGPAAKKKR